MKRLTSILAAAALAAPFAACTDDADLYDGETVKSDDGKTDASLLAVFLDAQFEGRLVTTSSFNDTQTIQDQLLYTVGQLNGMSSVGRVDKAKISNIQRKTTADGRTELTYTAVLPIAWGKKNEIPQSIELKLPLDISFSGQDSFAGKYKAKCVDVGAHDVDSGSMFYYYRPRASGCAIEATDVHTVNASVSPSPTQSVGKYPEYTKVWEDDRLEVLAIFGKFEDGATSGDAGISAYNTFISSMKQELGARNLTTIPASVPSSPGVDMPDIEFNASLSDGKQIHVVALLTDNVRVGLSEPGFRARYETLSSRADFVVYNGHAGLGTNVRALASAGKWVQGQYVIVYMNGCDTFAYIDDALFRAHKNINPDDTTGFKYIDIVNNAMPAFFHSMAGASMAMFRGLLNHSEPQTYEQIFGKIDRSQVVLVSGEQDNVFTPGGGGTPTTWNGLTDRGTLKRNESKSYSTPTLDAGTYQFTITGSNDSDLYVRVGSAPTTSQFDCRPFKTGSNESCSVTLAQPSTIHVMVRGFSSAASTFDIVGKKN